MKPQLNMGFDGFVWWFGIVEDREDPLKVGRVKVRIFNVHTNDTVKLPKDNLQWASVGMPVTSASLKGKGRSPTGIMEGSMVMGFFMDGNYCQQPVVMFTWHGMPNGESDVSGLATGTKKLKKGGLDREPKDPAKPKYPYNKVFESESGHAVEIDDTPGAERVHLYHRTGTYFEIDAQGQYVLKSVADGYDLTLKDKTIYVGGDAKIHVDGDATTEVLGKHNVVANGPISFKSSSAFKVYAPTIEMHEASSGTLVHHAQMSSAGYVSAFDDVNDVPDDVKGMYPLSAAASQPHELVAELPVEPAKLKGIPVDKTDFGIRGVLSKTSDIYKTPLAGRFSLADLSIKAVFAHEIKSGVLTVDETIRNLKALAVNCLVPLNRAYPNFVITSGFRPGDGESQHNLGMAADLQWSNFSGQDYLNVAAWITKNMPFDQLILEHGDNLWIHISYDPTKRDQRRNVLTMKGGIYEPGLKLYYK